MIGSSLDGGALRSVHAAARCFRRGTKPETIMPKRKKTTARKSPSAKTPSKKTNTKQDQLLALLRRPQGTTIEHAAKTLAWQPHSVRGFISGVLKKRLGLTIASDKSEGERVYRVSSAEADKSS